MTHLTAFCFVDIMLEHLNADRLFSPCFKLAHQSLTGAASYSTAPGYNANLRFGSIHLSWLLHMGNNNLSGGEAIYWAHRYVRFSSQFSLWRLTIISSGTKSLQQISSPSFCSRWAFVAAVNSIKRLNIIFRNLFLQLVRIRSWLPPLIIPYSFLSRPV